MKTQDVDPWLSARQAAELLLDYPASPRTRQQIRTLHKQITAACQAHLEHGQSGIACDKFGKSYRFLRSELYRWCRRRSERGMAYQMKEALNGRR